MPVKNYPFYSTICQICFCTNNIKRCSFCKTMPYCSKEHQQLDWPSHKKLCKAIAESNSKVPYEINSLSDLNNYKISLKIAWEISLGRKLVPYESTIYLNLRVCRICFNRECEIDCKNCLCVSYCSESHAKQDTKHNCNLLELCRLTDLTPVYDYEFNIINNKIPQCIQDFLDKTSAGNSDIISRTIIGHVISPCGTILYALQKLNIIKNQITIHIVGAAVEETKYRWDKIALQICSYLDHITAINFIFIGPEAIYHEDIQLCQKDIRILLRVFKKLYHEVDLTGADLVVAFNAGLHESEESWKPSVLKMLEAPLVLTGYLEEEIVKDKRIILMQTRELHIIQDCIRNPFASPKPFRNWNSLSEPVYYCNNYIFMCKNKYVL